MVVAGERKVQGCEMRNLQGKEMRTLRILRCQEIVQVCKLHRKQGEGEKIERCKKRSLSFLRILVGSNSSQIASYFKMIHNLGVQSPWILPLIESLA